MAEWRRERFLNQKQNVNKETGWNVYWSGANKERADEKNRLLRNRENSLQRQSNKEKDKGWVFQTRHQSVKQTIRNENIREVPRSEPIVFESPKRIPESKRQPASNFSHHGIARVPSSSL